MYSIKIMTKLFAFTIPAAIITAVASSVIYAGSGKKNRTQSQMVRSRAIFAAFAFLICLFAAHGAQAQATFTVTRTDDRNMVCVSGVDCSLREAVNAANAAATNDTINFAIPAASCPASVCTITLTNEISISNNGSLTINGTGANRLTIDGGAGTNRIFYSNAATFTLSGVTLTGGNGTGVVDSSLGGAIYAKGGTTIISGVYFNANTTTFSGGGIFFSGGTNHRVENSTFSGNTASNSGGGIFSSASLTVVNTTLSGNTAGNGFGGGIRATSNGTLTLRGDTITANTAGIGGGVFQDRGTLDFGNTIIAGNTGTNSAPEIGLGDDMDTGGAGATAASQGYNLIGDSAGDSTNTRFAITYQPTDIRDTPPLLDPLANYGGTTPTRRLQTGSPAIDKGKAFGLTTDQRGFTRPVDNPSIPNATGGDGADIGAFEVQAAPTAATVSVSGRVLSTFGRGVSNAVVTLTDQNGIVRTARTSSFGYYRFDEIAAGQTYVVNVSHKHYLFSPRVVSVNEDLSEFDFIANN